MSCLTWLYTGLAYADVKKLRRIVIVICHDVNLIILIKQGCVNARPRRRLENEFVREWAGEKKRVVSLQFSASHDALAKSFGYFHRKLP